MSLGCVRFVVLSVLVFGSLTAAWGFALRPPDGPAPWDGAAVLGLLGVLTVLSVRSLLKQRMEARLLEDASRGIPPMDGARGGAIGELQPATEAVLTAPFSGKPALLYSYSVSRMADYRTGSGRTRTTSVTAFEGEAMAPCEIRTAFGAVRLLEPPLVAAPRTPWKGPEALARAEAYLAAASFAEVVSPGTSAAMRRQVEAVQKESLASTGGFRSDSRISNPDAFLESPIELGRWDLEEVRFAPGETVTVLGRYDASRAGFTAVPSDVISGVALYKGGLAENAARKKAGVRFLSALALVLLAAQAGVGGPGLSARARERAAARAEEEAIPVATRLFAAATRGDGEALSKLLRRGADPSARDEDGRTLAHAAPDAPTLKLVLDAGSPVDARNSWGATPLVLAADDGDVARVRLLLDRGADPNALDDSGANALAHAADPGVRAALVAGGARDLLAAPAATEAAPTPGPQAGPRAGAPAGRRPQ